MQLVDTLIPILVLVRESAGKPAAEAAPRPVAARPAPPSPAPSSAAAAAPTGSGGLPFAPEALATLAMPAAAPAPTPEAAAAESSTMYQALGADAATTLSNRLDIMINDARNAARAAVLADSEFDAALFAVLAWADETLLAGSWAGASNWQRHLLQRQYFGTSTAGVAFFTRLDDLRSEQHDVREVYALCLSLGFRGRFAYELGNRALDEKRRATVQQVLTQAGVPAATGQLLFPDAYVSHMLDPAGAAAADATPASSSRFKPSRQTVLLFGLPLLVLVALYVTYQLIITQMVDALIPLIK